MKIRKYLGYGFPQTQYWDGKMHVLKSWEEDEETAKARARAIPNARLLLNNRAYGIYVPVE